LTKYFYLATVFAGNLGSKQFIKKRSEDMRGIFAIILTAMGVSLGLYSGILVERVTYETNIALAVAAGLMSVGCIILSSAFMICQAIRERL